MACAIKGDSRVLSSKIVSQRSTFGRSILGALDLGRLTLQELPNQLSVYHWRSRNRKTINGVWDKEKNINDLPLRD